MFTKNIIAAGLIASFITPIAVFAATSTVTKPDTSASTSAVTTHVDSSKPDPTMKKNKVMKDEKKTTKK